MIGCTSPANLRARSSQHARAWRGRNIRISRAMASRVTAACYLAQNWGGVCKSTLCAANKRGNDIRVRVLTPDERLSNLTHREILASALQGACLKRRKVPRRGLLVFEQDCVRDENRRALVVHASRLQQVVLGPQVLIYVRYQACPAQHWQLRRRRRLRHRCARHNPVGSYLVGAKTTPLTAAGRPPAVTLEGPGTRVTPRTNWRTALARTVHARGIRTRPLSCLLLALPLRGNPKKLV